MLNWSHIVASIKENLSYPFQTLEFTDDQIIDYLKRNALPKFELYFPQKWRLTINCSDPAIQVPNRRSEYYLIDPDEREIKNVVEFVPGMGTYIMNGHPYFGPWTAGGVEEFSLQTFNSGLLQPFSNFNYNIEFIAPNQLRISPKYSGVATIIYERGHDPELSTIDPNLKDIFIDLCQGLFMQHLGRLRKKYTSTTTPFGEITLNGEDIFNEGKEIFDRTIELMKMGSLPNISVDRG